MEVLSDWKFWAFTLNAIITITGFLVIKFNDFRHLEADVREIKESQNSFSDKLNDIDKRTAVLEERTT